MNEDIFLDIQARIAAADTRYGQFASTHEAIGVALEEWDELRAALHSNDLHAVADECLDLAAVLMRLADQLRAGEEALMLRSRK